MLSKWSMKQMELWETAPGGSMDITGPVMQRKLSGEPAREKRIYTLFDGRNYFCVLYTYENKKNIYIIYLYKIQGTKKMGKRIGCRQSLL